MKKYITVAALLAAGPAFANAETVSETYTPLNEDGWTLTSARGSGSSNKAQQNKEEGVIYSNDPWWKRSYATYEDMGITLSDKGDNLSFSFTMSMDVIEVHNGIFSVALTGTTEAEAATIMMGYGGQYDANVNTHFKSAVVGSNDKDVYLFDTDWVEEGFSSTYNCTTADKTFALPSTSQNGKTQFETTFAGTISWSVENNIFVLSLQQTYNGQTIQENYNLGETYSMDGISIAMDGNSTNGDKDIFKVSNFIIEHTYTLIPEPSTFGLLAGLGALALVGTRRRRR